MAGSMAQAAVRCDQPVQGIGGLTEPMIHHRAVLGGLEVVEDRLGTDGMREAVPAQRQVFDVAVVYPPNWVPISAALLATRYNDQVLARPTLVMPHDNRASRYVRNLCHLRLLNVALSPGNVQA